MPIIFLFCHFIYYFVGHLWSVLLWHSYYLHLITCVAWVYWSFYQGACYYMDYFAKKYESQLAKLSQLETEIVQEAETPLLSSRLSK